MGIIYHIIVGPSLLMVTTVLVMNMAKYIVINIETIFIWLGVTFLSVLHVSCLRDGFLTILGCPRIGCLNMPWLKITAARRLTYNWWSQTPFMCSSWVFCEAVNP